MLFFNVGKATFKPDVALNIKESVTYTHKGIKLMNYTLVSDWYSLLVDNQSPGICIGIRTEKAGSVHSW